MRIGLPSTVACRFSILSIVRSRLFDPKPSVDSQARPLIARSISPPARHCGLLLVQGGERDIARTWACRSSKTASTSSTRRFSAAMLCSCQLLISQRSRRRAENSGGTRCKVATRQQGARMSSAFNCGAGDHPSPAELRIGVAARIARSQQAIIPTLPSRLMPSSFCASTANSIGSCLSTSRAKPLTIRATASSASEAAAHRVEELVVADLRGRRLVLDLRGRVADLDVGHGVAPHRSPSSRLSHWVKLRTFSAPPLTRTRPR